eukprot:TRINITY_DN3384_c0_g1_i1.p1 TRINITY_DN3384_c0_g1~~TRINITY_DN3384_c0_g1_i1.p1  ORF type:complete len:158 (+),score=35.13 TRINITY_DN3384_c0_g1_i1:55-528(+)
MFHFSAAIQQGSPAKCDFGRQELPWWRRQALLASSLAEAGRACLARDRELGGGKAQLCACSPEEEKLGSEDQQQVCTRQRRARPSCGPSTRDLEMASEGYAYRAGAWDWPLSRLEKKARLVVLDRQVLIADRDDIAEQLAHLRRRGTAEQKTAACPE